VGAIDSQRQHGNLSSALRLFVLDFYRTQLSDLHKQRGENDSSEIVAAARAFS
jgi:predicted DNA-binding ribbon-helix-helix protein